MEPPNDNRVQDADDFNGQPSRLKVQKKACRARCVLRDDQKRLDIVLTCWLGAPLERLSSELQWLDEVGKGLYDIVFDDSLNPFYMCRCRLAALVANGVAGALKPVFAMYPEHMHAMMMAKVRSLGLDFDCQIWWRLLNYRTFPALWAYSIHPGIDKAKQDSCVDYFFNKMKDCCRRRGFCLKVSAIFPDAASLCQDKDFRNLLLAWANTYHFTDMATERLLAHIRQATDDDDVDVERVCSNDFLAQLVREHRRKGFAEPVCKTRQQLLDSGLELRCKRRAKQAKPRSGFVNFMMKAEAERKKKQSHDGSRFSKEDDLAWQAAKGEEYRLLDEQAKLSELAQARLAFADAQAEKQEEEQEQQGLAEPAVVGQRFATVIDAIGDSSTPYTAQSFGHRIRNKKQGQGADARPAGFTRYAHFSR